MSKPQDSSEPKASATAPSLGLTAPTTAATASHPTETRALPAPLNLKTPQKLAAVFLGGTLGTALRILISSAWELQLGEKALFFPDGATVHPWYLLTVNLIGSFLLGMIGGVEIRHQRNRRTTPGLRKVQARHLNWWKLFFGTGMCGAFTTYGSLIMLSVGIQSPHPTALLQTLAWTVTIMVAGLFFAVIGWRLGEGKTAGVEETSGETASKTAENNAASHAAQEGAN
ncbi:fluoride efflux transporter FluC [Boudabousia marimammalium]|uniref:Fluoride-specific ion channel n=1 Tax=Boudabousia marimammalium TaxID=156892 RepID=A0A1Q5PT34_9ACTO|nr:CrcB family protein [Boudabousia marimammalium]OKL50602.1 hypothetical protein BM477_01190 [Boudabousia marimammalium]